MAAHLTLVNQTTGELTLKISHAATRVNPFDHLCRFNYYSVLWVRAGAGTLRADFADHPVGAGQLLCFSPYQPFMLHAATTDLQVSAVQFHPDFFGIVKHQPEVACNGVLPQVERLELAVDVTGPSAGRTRRQPGSGQGVAVARAVDQAAFYAYLFRQLTQLSA